MKSDTLAQGLFLSNVILGVLLIGFHIYIQNLKNSAYSAQNNLDSSPNNSGSALNLNSETTTGLNDETGAKENAGNGSSIAPNNDKWQKKSSSNGTTHINGKLRRSENNLTSLVSTSSIGAIDDKTYIEFPNPESYKKDRLTHGDDNFLESQNSIILSANGHSVLNRSSSSSKVPATHRSL